MYWQSKDELLDSVYNPLDSVSETRANEVWRTLLHKTSLSSVSTLLLGKRVSPWSSVLQWTDNRNAGDGAVRLSMFHVKQSH